MFYFVVSVWRFLTTPDGNTCPVEYLYPAPEIRFCIEEGDHVVITDLIFATQYNGEPGVVYSAGRDNNDGRYRICLDVTRKELAVKVSNIRLKQSSTGPETKSAEVWSFSGKSLRFKTYCAREY